MKREPVFDLPHKGLRIALSELTAAATGCDFTVAAGRETFESLFGAVWKLIAAHSHTEERVTFAELDHRSPGASDPLRAEHRALDETYATLEAAVANGSYADSPAAFVRALNRFSAAFQAHMNREEDEIEPLVWQYFSDEEIQEHRRGIMTSDGPEKILCYFRFVFYALTEKETNGLLERVQTLFPPEAFAEAEMLAARAKARRALRL